jgi:hypothetical protein
MDCTGYSARDGQGHAVPTPGHTAVSRSHRRHSRSRWSASPFRSHRRVAVGQRRSQLSGAGRELTLAWRLQNGVICPRFDFSVGTGTITSTLRSGEKRSRFHRCAGANVPFGADVGCAYPSCDSSAKVETRKGHFISNAVVSLTRSNYLPWQFGVYALGDGAQLKVSPRAVSSVPRQYSDPHYP